MKKINIKESDYSRIFVVSDVHGYFCLLKKMLEEIDFKKEDLLVIAGDSCDRGPETDKIYDKYISLKKKGYNIIHLMGNHEDMCLDYILKNKNKMRWFLNGGKETLKAYENKEKKLKEHINYIKKMPYILETDNYIIIHAGIDPELSLEKQSAWDILWIRDKFIEKTIKKINKEIIFGHTPIKSGEIKFYDNNTIGINCGVIRNETLGCIELKDRKEYYVKN
ncbi:MAG: metallophosphoesterase family protein [Fusobacteriota bacterium]